MFKSIRSSVVSCFALLTFAICSAAVQAADEVVYFHPDVLGSASAAYSADGDLCWSQFYTPYGDKIDPMDGVAAGGCGFLGAERGHTGHVADITGLTYMQQRYYDPTLMRFLSIDPVGVDAEDPRTFNRYAYVFNNPYRYIDPTGEIAFLAVFAPMLATGGGAAAVGGTAASGTGILGAIAGGLGLFGLAKGIQGVYNESSEDDKDTTDIKPNKQREHIAGTPANKNREKQKAEGESISTWDNPEEADELTVDTWNNGTPVPGKPNQRTKEYNRPTGTSNGETGSQVHTGVKSHIDSKGKIHGHPWGNDRSTDQTEQTDSDVTN